MGPCAKQRVVAVAYINDEPMFVGENICVTPQTKCPRVTGEAYVKCITTCAQLGHAEEVTLRLVRMAGYHPSDITRLDVFGHTGPCDHCRAMLDDLGLLAVTNFRPNDPLPIMTPDDHERIAAAYNLYAPSSHSRACRKS